MGSNQSSTKQPEQPIKKEPVVDKKTFKQSPKITIAPNSMETLTFSNVFFDRVPEKILITVYEDALEREFSLQIESINLFFGNHCGLFCRDTKQDLKIMSRVNREINNIWYPHNTLFISVRKDFPRCFVCDLENKRKGPYHLCFEINVQNPYENALTPSIVVECIY